MHGSVEDTKLSTNKQHSLSLRHFHLKIRIPTEMYLRVFPAAQVLGDNHACVRQLLQPFKQLWEPLAFRFETQPLFPWSITRLLIESDVDDGEYHP